MSSSLFVLDMLMSSPLIFVPPHLRPRWGQSVDGTVVVVVVVDDPDGVVAVPAVVAVASAVAGPLNTKIQYVCNEEYEKSWGGVIGILGV